MGAIDVSRHKHCPEDRSIHRKWYRQRLQTTQVRDLTLAIPKLRNGDFFTNWLKARGQFDKALYIVVIKA